MKQILMFILSIFLCVSLMACVGVRQQDLDAWVGMPVEALDTHSIFLTIPMVKTVTPSGIEIRNYVNKVGVTNCMAHGDGNLSGSGFSNISGNNINSTVMNQANFQAFQNCTSRMRGCDNIFYIKNNKVLEYKPVGSCFTNQTAQPESRYLRLMNN